jgi:hypothetical protein
MVWPKYMHQLIHTISKYNALPTTPKSTQLSLPPPITSSPSPFLSSFPQPSPDRRDLNKNNRTAIMPHQTYPFTPSSSLLSASASPFRSFKCTICTSHPSCFASLSQITLSSSWSRKYLVRNYYSWLKDYDY